MTSSIKQLVIAALAFVLPALATVSSAPLVSSVPPSWPTKLTVKFNGGMHLDTYEMNITYDADGSGIGEYDRVKNGVVHDTGDVLITEVDGRFVIHYASVWSLCVGTLDEKNDPEFQGPHGHTGMFTFNVTCDGLSQPGGIATQTPLPYWENH